MATDFGDLRYPCGVKDGKGWGLPCRRDLDAPVTMLGWVLWSRVDWRGGSLGIINLRRFSLHFGTSTWERIWSSTNSLIERFQNTVRIFRLDPLIVLASFLRMVQEYFVDNEFSKYLAIQSVLLKFEIEIIYLGIRWLVLFLVKLLEEWVLESLLST